MAALLPNKNGILYVRSKCMRQDKRWQEHSPTDFSLVIRILQLRRHAAWMHYIHTDKHI